MYNFLSFIDSKAIREYNKDRAFTPAEQAVLISRSFRKTLDEKLAALEYLYEKYCEEDFKDDSVGCHCNEREVPFRTKLGDYISGMKKSLADRSLTDGYIYRASYRELGFDDFTDKYFTNYQNAYGYLKNIYEENCEDPEIKYTYRISRIQLDNTNWSAVRDYTFDNDFRLIFVDKDPPPEDSKYYFDISEHFVDIALPFKKGELIKNINHMHCWRKYPYYVATGRYRSSEKTAVILQNGDDSDMCVFVYAFVPDKFHPNGGVYDDYTEFSSLDLDYCDEQDIEHIDNGTKYLAAAMDDECCYDMMHLLCDYGNGWRYAWLDVDEYVKKKLGADCEKST